MKVEDLEIKSPCCESWEKMSGTSTRRFCDVCQKDVYNLSALSPQEVRDLFASTPRPCIRYTYDESSTIVFAHPQVRRQQRGLQQLVRAAALALPLTLLAPLGMAEAYDGSAADDPFPAVEVDESQAVEPIWEVDGRAVLIADSEESSDDDKADDDDSSTIPPIPPRPPRRDTTKPLMGEPPPEVDLLFPEDLLDSQDKSESGDVFRPFD